MAIDADLNWRLDSNCLVDDGWKPAVVGGAGKTIIPEEGKIEKFMKLPIELNRRIIPLCKKTGGLAEAEQGGQRLYPRTL
jgi:hypothetical protein